MTNREAIEQLKFDMSMMLFNPDTGEELTPEQVRLRNEDNYKTYLADQMAIAALEKQEKYEAQWHDDMGNPLEPIKITSALDSEIMKLEYRKEHKPKDVSILDYTVIAALMECLEKRTEDAK